MVPVFGTGTAPQATFEEVGLLAECVPGEVDLRRGELLGLRWAAVHLADPDGAYLRVKETWVLSGVDSPKSEAGERTIALGQRVATELFAHRGQTAFAGDEERVFCSPTKGTPFDVVRYAATFRLALARAGIGD